MALRIAQFATQCKVSRRGQSAAHIVDNLARNRLSREIAFHLGPSLARQSAIIRIRRLTLSFSIPASEFEEDALAKVWVQTLGHALFTALAYPSGSGPIEIFRADSLAEFLASVVRDLLEGDTSRRWAYTEFAEILGLDNPGALLALLCQWPRETLPVLLSIEKSGRLEKLLGRLDELALERLIATLSEAEGAYQRGADQEGDSAIRLLVAVADHVSHDPPRSFRILRTRGYALQLYVRSHVGGGPSPSPRRLFHGLCALSCLLERPYILDSPEFDLELGSPQPDVSALFGKLRLEVQSAAHSPLVPRLVHSLAQLRSALRVEVTAPVSGVRRIGSDWCGVFFLCETLDRLGWVPQWQRLTPFQAGGVSCLLAGLALSTTFRFDTDFTSLDGGIALFAGYIDEPDLAHCRSFFSTTSSSVRREVLLSALGIEPTEAAIADWPATLEALSGKLLAEFAARIRGFRKASPRSIVNSFLRHTGLITLTEDKVRACCEPSPFNVALHISGVDQPVESVSWLGHRRLEFDLGEL